MGFNKGSGFGSGGGGGGGGVVETYNNSGDNRVLTSVNSTTINGESTLLYDGTTLSSSAGAQFVGATILGSTLNVTGAAKFASSVSGSSTLEAVGATTLGSTLGVTGAATFQDTTSVFTSNALTSTPGAAFTIEAKSAGNLTSDDKFQALFRDTTENGFVRVGFQSRESGESSYDVSKTWLLASRGHDTATSAFYNIYYQDLGASALSLRGDGQATFHKNIIVGNGVAGGISGSGGLEIVGNSVLGGNLSVSGNVGIGTSSPQHKLDVPSMGGMILAYNQITGAIDGTGGRLLIGARTVDHRTTGNWTVKHWNGGASSWYTPQASQLGITFTMPASGRAEVSVANSLLLLQSSSNNTWAPPVAEWSAALTASGNDNPDISFNSNDSNWYMSLSTNSTSYVPAGPRNEFEQQVLYTDTNVGGFRTSPAAWVMTGSAGSSHTVYLAFAFNGKNSDYVAFLAYGGTGSTDANSPESVERGAPNAGPVALKVVSLPSAS